MSRNVKPKRKYDSPRRREQAAATRLAILEAAEQLFVDNGYVATSVGEIAERADVALKTVYAVFGTKAEVLRALWNLRMRGDEEPVPIYERPWFRALADEPDPKRRLELLARNARTVRERTAALTEVLRLAAPADEQIAGIWRRMEHDLYEIGMTAMVETLVKDKALAVDRKTAKDILWTLIHPEVYLLLVRQRGWTPKAYERWVARVLCEQLLAK
jgi:AcrR family transcriptional regulator